MNNENDYNRGYVAENYLKNCVQRYAHFLFMTFILDTINYGFLDKNYAFFQTLFLHGYNAGNG